MPGAHRLLAVSAIAGLVACGGAPDEDPPAAGRDAEGYVVDFEGTLDFVELRPDPAHPGAVIEAPDPRFRPRPGWLAQLLDTLWEQSRQRMCDEIIARTRTRLAAATGQTAHDLRCAIPDRGALSARMTGQTLELKYRLPTASLTFAITQPMPLGSWADPAFRASWDTELRIVIPIPASLSGGPAARAVRATSAVARVRDATIEADNVAGGIVSVADDLLGVLWGRGIYGPAEDAMDARAVDVTAQVNAALGLVDLALARLASEGFCILFARLDEARGAVELKALRCSGE